MARMGSRPEWSGPWMTQEGPPRADPEGESGGVPSFQTPPTPLPRAREEPLLLRPPGAGKPMMRRVLVIALAAAAVFAAILGAASPAQDRSRPARPDSTPTVIAPAPAESAAPEVTTAPRRDPAETPTQAPVETATQAPTADATRPGRLARCRPRPPPRPPRPRAPPRRATRPSRPPARRRASRASRRPRSPTPRSKVVKVKKCSTSTSGRECKVKQTDRDDQHEVQIEAPKLTTSTGAPAPTNPSFSLATVGPGSDRRAELLHRQVPDPSVPAPDLPGRRHAVRHALGGPRRDQRDRDRLRPQPQRLLRRRPGLDAVHALHLEDVRRRRQPRRRQGPLQPGRRDLRGRALPARRRAPTRTCAGRSSPTTTPTGTSTPCCCAPASSAACRATSSAR